MTFIETLPELSDSDFTLNFDAPSEPEEPFKGFLDAYNLPSCVLVLTTFGASVLFCSAFPNALTGFVAFLTMLVISTWLKLHSMKMTRNEVIYFGARNMLEVNPPVFTFGLPEPVDDCLTPADGIQRHPPPPQTLWDAIFTNDKKIQMDKFYREHYGRVHETGTKMLQEYEMQKAKEAAKGNGKTPP